MKKYFAYALMLGAGAFTFSCNNAELEERVEKLEQRVVVLEGNGGVAAAKPVLNTKVADVQEVTGPAAAFEFVDEVYDFGTVTEGEVVEHTFKFKNVGEVPLVVQNASASCGCTVPSKPDKPIPVGETGEIKVRFDSDNRVGTQNKTVTITANTKPSITTVKIKGTVVAGQDLSAGPVKQ